MATQTPNFNLDKPEVGGDVGVWGGLLNGDLDIIDAAMKTHKDAADAAQTTADAALPVAGGVMTGEVDVLTARGAEVALGSVSGNQNLDFDLGNFFSATITGATTFTFVNVPVGGSFALVAVIALEGAGTNVTWPPSVEWPDGGTVPTLVGSSIVVLVSVDDGTTWKASARVNFT